jgi:outer membrane lipoprotein carrier protein
MTRLNVFAVALAGALAAAGSLPFHDAAAQQPSALQVLEGAAGRYRGAPAVCADFVQERTIPLLGDTRSGRGVMCQKQPNLFSMRFTEPQGDRLVVDGREFCQYTPSTDPKQAICAGVERAGGSPDFHSQFLDRPAEKYRMRLDGQEAVDGSQTHKVVLVPLSAAAFREAVLWIDARQSLVRRVEIREENGSVNRISFSNIDLRASPSAETFRFAPPAGVEVVRP